MRRMPIVGNAPRRRRTPAEAIVGPWAEDAILALTANTNLLLHGEDRVVTLAVAWLLPVLEPPLLTWRPGRPLNLPLASGGGTLVLRDIAALTPFDQLRLDAWLRKSPRATRIVSTTTQSIIPLIESGAFLERLYYRINTVVVSVSTP
jgi:hypothetical protein